MSVFLCVKLNIAAEGGSFDEAIQMAFKPEGAYQMLELPTLQWKIWGIDPEKREGSGFYLFAAREAAEAYAKQSIATLGARPGITNVTAQIWTIAEEQTRITKGPIDVPQIKG